MISFIPERNYLFKVSNLSARIRCESCSILRMPMPRIFNIDDVSGVGSSVFVFNCKHSSNFVLIVNSEQVSVCLVHIEKTNIFETGSSISCIMYYFKREQNLLTNSI